MKAQFYKRLIGVFDAIIKLLTSFRGLCPMSSCNYLPVVKVNPFFPVLHADATSSQSQMGTIILLCATMDCVMVQTRFPFIKHIHA